MSIPTATDISGDTGSQESLSLAQSWIQKCKKEHKSCNGPAVTLLPHRVLDLGTVSGPEDASVRLYLSTGQYAPYVCLSHCWGGAQHITTTTATLAARQENISWNELPKTFQEVIIFSRRLKIQFIWIDSLCIIQDSETDWATQAAKMPEIYENAHVTLAATHSANSSGGCFSRAGAEYKARGFTVEDRNGQTHELFMRRHVPHSVLAGWHYKLEIARNYPLLSRAWVLQERLLSSRVLYFGQHELFWECKEVAACECSFVDRVKSDQSAKLGHHQRLARNQNNYAELVDQWHSVVESYTDLNMTVEKDKFPAISGLAKRMKRMEKTQYQAGLWMDSFVADMLWKVDYPTDRPSVWRAPSWSWASVNSPVKYVLELKNENQQVETYFDILGGQTILASDDDMGQLSSSYLDIDAVFSVVSIVIYTKPEGSLVSPGPDLFVNGVHFNPKTDSGLGLSFTKETIKLDCNLPPTTEETSFPGYGLRIGMRPMLCMRFAKVGSYEYSMLLSCVDYDSAKYDRVGLVMEYRGGGRARRMPWNDIENRVRSRIKLV